jgi:diguanylate cyclase (GGDEF)-like protein
LYHAVERQVAHDEYSGGFIFIDCSNTHELNNEYGHHTVDEGFREIGEVLRGSLREGDLCCRRSGDEFIVYLPGDKEVVTIVSDRLREILEEGVPLLKGVRLSARLYVVHAEQIGSYEEAMRLIEGADLKLGERKRKRGQDVPD